MTLTQRFSYPAFALTAALLLLFASCGGDDDDDNSTSVATATQDAATVDAGSDEGDPTSEATEDPDDDGGNDGDGDGLDACALLTPAEVGRVLGEPAPEGEQQNSSPFFGCSWTTADFNSIDVSVTSGPDGVSLFEFNNDDAEEVIGLGDRAQYLPGLLGLLEVLDGDYYLSLSVSSFDLDEAEARDTSIGLADRALGRLP